MKLALVVLWLALAAAAVVMDALGGWQLVAGVSFLLGLLALLDADVRRWTKGKP